MQLFCKKIIYKHINRNDQIYGYDNDNKIKLTELDKVQVVNLGTSQETCFYRLQQRSLLNFIGYLTYYAISHTISVNY